MLWVDFNIVRSQSEDFGGDVVKPNEMKEFLSSISSCDLDDMKTVGPLYTWSNRHSLN